MTASTDIDLAAVMVDLDRAENIFGALRPEFRARLFAVLDNPTPETWADARGIILSPPLLSLWQAALRFTDYDGDTGNAAPPTPQQLAAALTGATR